MLIIWLKHEDSVYTNTVAKFQLTISNYSRAFRLTIRFFSHFLNFCVIDFKENQNLISFCDKNILPVSIVINIYVICTLYMFICINQRWFLFMNLLSERATDRGIHSCYRLTFKQALTSFGPIEILLNSVILEWPAFGFLCIVKE